MSFWFLGFVCVVIAAALYAGMRTQQLFFRHPKNYEGPNPVFEFDRVIGYCVIVFCSAIAWPIVVPLYTVFKLGQYVNRKA